MKKIDGKLVFSPSDLITYTGGIFASYMDRYECEYPGEFEKDEPEGKLVLTRTKGYEHEAANFKTLQKEIPDVADLSKVPYHEKYERTKQAMKEGRGLIFQAELSKPPFRGYADFLVRVERKSSLGDYSYEVWDTKLARTAKAYIAIQLCCYSEMLEEIQGKPPENFTVILGDNTRKSFRVEDYFYYYLGLKNAFLTFQNEFAKDLRPMPDGGQEFGNWSELAEQILEDTDHLSLVANINTLQIKKLEAFGIDTMTKLGLANPKKLPPKMDQSIFERLIQQARLQCESAGKDKPVFEVLAHDKDIRRGLAMLPPENPSDIYFDMEGYPLIVGGLEYLFGATVVEKGKSVFRDWWAHNPTQEKKAFEAFIDFAYKRWEADRAMHIYHYGDYEVSAMRRLASRYGTREFEVDEFLRGHVFINLYNVVRHGIRVGEPSYSIKNIEKIYGQARDSDVKGGGDSIVEYARWIDEQDGSDYKTSVILKSLSDYNQADCDSTKSLTDWLRGLQMKSKIAYVVGADTSSSKSEKAEHPSATLANEVLTKLPEDADHDEEQRVAKLMADVLGFHRREAKPFWWNYFDKLEGHTESELYDDSECLAHISLTGTEPEKIGKSVVLEFAFDANQEYKIRTEDSCRFHHDPDIEAEVVGLDGEAGLIKLRFGPKHLKKIDALPDKVSLIPHNFIATTAIEAALFELCEQVESALPKLSLPSALKDFLLRTPPRTKARKKRRRDDSR